MEYKLRKGSQGEVFDFKIDLLESYPLFRFDINLYLFAHLHTRDLLRCEMKFFSFEKDSKVSN